jgi:predicted RNA methylase
MTFSVEYRNDGTVVPKEIRKGVSAVTAPYSNGYDVGAN